MIEVIVGLSIICLSFVAIVIRLHHSFEEERIRWEEERKDLCSRIQARDYPEYNLGEVRKIKAEKVEHDPMKGIEVV